MSLSIAQTVTAVGPNLTASFLASGGTAPYTYSVRANGAGGTITSSTGVYTAPSVASSDPRQLFDTIAVNDSAGAVATAQILVGTPLLLFCDIIERCLGLANGRVKLWDQKIFQPTDFGLYVAVSVPTCKPFGNTNSYDGSGPGLKSNQSVNMAAVLDIDVISRGPDARDRKEEVLMALASTYSEQQQEINSFHIGKLPPGAQFINLSQIDGAAIPYRFKISVQIQYTVTKVVPVSYFDSFPNTAVTTNP